MRKNVLSIVTALLTASFLYALNDDPEYLKARKNGGVARLLIKVVNDEGVAVSGASIDILMGMNFREKSYSIKGMSDSSGSFLAEGKTTGNEIVINVQKDGYYESTKKICLIEMGKEHKVNNGCWQPWGIEVPLYLREVRQPSDLVTFNQYIAVPATNTWMGFDMQMKDWTAPFGKGKYSDFEMLLTWDGKPQYTTKETSLEMRFIEPLAGCYAFTNFPDCEFGGAYLADTNRIVHITRMFSSGSNDGTPWQKGLDESQSLVLRTRCKETGDGNILTANYSTIKSIGVSAGWKGSVKMWMRYYYNPVPNSLNLEPKR